MYKFDQLKNLVFFNNIGEKILQAQINLVCRERAIELSMKLLS